MHNNIAARLTNQNDYQGALKHYHKAIHGRPDFVLAHYNLGLLFLKHSKFKEANIQFRNVVTLNPGHIGATFYLGVFALAADNLQEAELAFKAVLTQDPEHNLALNNLGVIALKQQHEQLAVDYFSRALAYAPNNIEARNNLASTFMNYDRFDNAFTHYQILLENDPDNQEYLYNAGVAQMALGYLATATTIFGRLLGLNPQHAATLTNLGAIYSRLHNKKQAICLLTQALDIDPQNGTAKHLLNALTGCRENIVANQEYTTNLFNNYALYYESHLQKYLNYQVPNCIITLCQELNLTSFAHVLDLGCGTGLCGLVLRTRTQKLTGVDIAHKMLKEARKKAIYDLLIESEIIYFLNTQSCGSDQNKYDLLVMADVLPYFDDLALLFASISRHPMPQGYFIFTTEISTDQPWQLQESARFSHHIDYITSLCQENNFTIIRHKQIIARTHEKQPLFVHLFAVKIGV
ncbi:MAG: hypothetical protein A3F46_07770 [Legionellales bacterium RIFCSPHIGHO2_12_FULL_42_9]|nr:MAG: hypothetical protein A3F46_07770 [Legionellales bacterium RIFCSPHIGHO2_12_FULL_42_9]